MINRVLVEIRLSRTSKDYSQEYVASKMNISQSYYAKLESCKSEISLKQLFTILELFEIDIVPFFEKIKKEYDVEGSDIINALLP